MNSDRIPDLVVTMSSGTQAISLADGKLLHGFSKPLTSFSIDGFDDLDQDGSVDYVVAGRVGNAYSLAAIVSGRDGQAMRWFGGHGMGVTTVAGLFDLDRDGVRDVLVGDGTFNGSLGKWKGRVNVYSGRGNTLSIDRSELSVAKGGTAHFTLDAGDRHHGETYVIVGSTTGTSPGLKLAEGVVVPLVPDSYFLLLLGAPNAWIQPSIGVLPKSSATGAKLVLPPGLSDLAGLTLHHAFVTLDLSQLAFRHASNAVRLKLQR